MSIKLKNFQRNYFRSLRRNISVKQRRIASLSLAYLVFFYDLLKTSKNIAIFLPFDGEINTYPLILQLWKKNFNVFLPVIHLDNTKLLLFVKYDIHSKMKLNKFNILEPEFEIKNFISIFELDKIFVPLVAFDNFGNRLGMGHGFYDRILINAKKKSIGLAFNCQMVNRIYNQFWDISLSSVLTPSKLFIFS